MLWLTCSLLEVSSGLGICQESFLPGPQKSGFQLEIAIFFSGFFFSSLSSGKSISIIKFLEGTILTKMKKVKLSQHKVMFELTCAKVSFWNFQSMKLSLDWLFIFIFAGKNAFIFTFSWERKIVFHAAVYFKLTAAFFTDMSTQAEVVTQAAWADPMQGFGNDQSYLEIVLKREEPQDNKHVRARLPCRPFTLFQPQKSFISLVLYFLHATRQNSWSPKY